MTDPVKKYEELKLLTERTFSNLFKRVKTPPSMQQSAALKSYREKYQIRYKIVGSPLRKEYNAMDLVKAYKDGEIDDDTQLVQVGVRNPQPAKFSEFKKYEPYKSELTDNKESSEPEFNDSVKIGFIDFPGNPAKKGTTEVVNIKDLAHFLMTNPNFQNLIKVLENNRWVFLKKSSIYEIIKELNNSAPAPATTPAPAPAINSKIYYYFTHYPADTSKENIVLNGNFKDIAKILKSDPSLENFTYVYDKTEYKSLKSSSYYEAINSLIPVV